MVCCCRRGNDLVHTYKHGFTGFAARLTAEEAKVIAKKQGVVSVFPDPNYQLHTTHSWDFLKYQTAVKIDSGPPSSAASDGSYDSIIGILDTGKRPFTHWISFFLSEQTKRNMSLIQ